MDPFNSHPNLKIEHHSVQEKEQHFKLIGSQRKKSGQKIFGYNPDTKKVYEVELQKNQVIDLSKKSKSTYKAVVNPKHPMLWSLNIANAKRKFEKHGLECQ